MAVIYKITNKINGWVYIGETTLSIEERFKTHIKTSKRSDGKGDALLYEDMRKYGVENFSIEQIDECYDRHKFIIEKYWTEKYLKDGYACYNSNLGSSMSKNTQQKLSELRKNSENTIYTTPEFAEKSKRFGEQNGMYGKSGANALNGNIVIAKNADGTIFREFPSMTAVLEYLGIKGHVGVVKACRENTIYRGYYWEKEWRN